MSGLADHFGAEHVDLGEIVFTPELLASLPAHLARHYRVLPIVNSPLKLLVALADPSDLDAIDALAHVLQREVEICVADADQLEEFIQRLYGTGTDEMLCSPRVLN